jgi:simple sugar transport system permease protein
MNFIAALLFDWLLDTYLRTPSAQGRSYSPIVLPSATLMPFVQGTRFGPGFVIAVVAAILVYIYVFQTTRGYEQRMTGAASLFAKYGGIRIDRAALRGMMISGALCGLAGAIEVLGVHRRVMGGFSTGLGFDGLMVSILGGMHPFGVALGAIFIAGLRQGALTLEWASRIPRQLGGGIIALIILLMAAKSMLLNWMERAAKRIGRAPAREEGI